MGRPASQSVPRGSSRRRRVALVAAVVVGASLGVLVLLSVIEHHAYSGRVLPGVEIDGIHASGHHDIAVYDDLARLAVSLSRAPLRARVGSRDLSADPSLLDLTVDARATTDAAIADGRGGNPFGRLLGTVLRRFRPDHVHLRVQYDESRLEGILDGWNAETLHGEIEGGLRFEGSTVVPIEPRAGTGILRDQARVRLAAVLAGSQRPVVVLPVGTIRPRVGAAAVATAARRARRLLSGDITLVTDSTSLRVTPRLLAGSLGTQIVGHRLDVTVDGARLHAALSARLGAIEAAPVSASFEVTSENAVRVVPSRVGREIDMAAVARAILRGDRRIVAPAREITPVHDTKWAQALGIVGQVASFTTNYPPGQDRVKNIHRGADLLNNTVIEPGKVFSLNQAVGPRTKARGFVPAPVFAQGEFFDDFGGGVSQLATTTYNAGFFGGYEDITHQPHTIYISRYPAGREATVNYGAIDLQFRDDTPHGVLIRTYYTDTSVTVSLYGDTDGRTVHEANRTITNPVLVTDELVQCPASPTVDPANVCATVPKGETKQLSTGDPGFDVAFDRLIDEPRKPERREHYTWHYTMLPNQILVGDVPPTSTTAAKTTSTKATTTTAPKTPRSTTSTTVKPAAGTTTKP